MLAISSPLAWSQQSQPELPPLDCVISPYQTVDLASSVPGVLNKIYVEKSDFIAKGKIAATLDAGVEQASVVLAQARADIESEVEVSKVNHAFDQRRKERIDALYEKKSVSFDTKDQAEREFNLSAWRLQQALDLKHIRQLELRRAQEQLKQKIIRTPIDGYVLQVFKESGEYVEDQPIMRIAQLDPLYVEAIVPIEFYGRISAGMTAQVYPETNVQQQREAVVTIVDKVGDAASGTFAVRLNLPNPDYQLPAGLKCSMKFTPAAATSVSSATTMAP
ncbi:efflux RND transporter periplasmic adaptor subunit [Dasania sp. GY-MA-18]|uniref:Efflux RND transporter periplasmic adaptor subunit n=2 Tax=Dasania TaxID=503005 RepID=A0A9J6RGT6_9GAMM|nr:efflux RND transporter periplasmic adaptor subunit [Dasania phycosphaerae]MCR8921442.1 efflux RND transporter periplasmic adaptor subunit [Dasania sp. GY-MA-18]MCZ0863870.1 efflux RND transporter periplasmic adaptor subunit [Dasania phycosphaerae]MCZ0867598.1 efflux RND transporter periplasmic adaptor subunit [Dasania phycosphaerae]